MRGPHRPPVRSIGARPDHVGDIRNAPFPDRTFAEVYFERMPADMFTGESARGLDEASPLLRPGGRLVIETGVVVPLAEVVERLTELGFEAIGATEVSAVRVFQGVRIDATKGAAP